MYKALIVDDVESIREMLKNDLITYCKNIEVVGVAGSIKEAKAQLLKLKPDLVFLDVELSDGTSFELLRELKQINFKIIFISSFDHYAIKAFKFSAIDYILKPIDHHELIDAVNRAVEVADKEESEPNINALLLNLNALKNQPKKIVLKTAEHVHFIDVDEVIRCEADVNYTRFYLTNGNKILVAKTLKEYEELLSDQGFFRVHQSHLINLKFIDSFDKKDGGYLILKDKSRLPVASSKRSQLLHIYS